MRKIEMFEFRFGYYDFDTWNLRYRYMSENAYKVKWFYNWTTPVYRYFLHEMILAPKGLTE